MSTTDPRDILRSRTDLPEDEIIALSNGEAWQLVRGLSSASKPRLTEVCFTGFRPAERKEYEELAVQSELAVVKSVTQNLAILVCGPKAGSKKKEKAGKLGAHEMDIQQFKEFLDTGEMPSLV